MNFLRITFAITILAIRSGTISAQTYRNSIGLSVGTFGLHTLDQQASPLQYAGKAYPLYGLNYHHQRGRSQFNLQLSGGMGTMNPERFGPRTYDTKLGDGTPFSYQISSELYHVRLEASYLRRVGPAKPGRFTAWVGGSLGESLLYADEVANFPWVVNTATFSPVVQASYSFGPGHTLTLQADMAVAGLITRATWANFPKSTDDNNVVAYFKQGTHPATLATLRQVNVQLGWYTCRISPHLSLNALYRAQYLRFPDPRPIHSLSSSLVLEAQLHF